MPKGVDKWNQATTRPQERPGIEPFDGESPVVDPAGSGGVRIKQDLEPVVKNEAVIAALRPNSAPNIIRGFEDLHRNAGIG